MGSKLLMCYVTIFFNFGLLYKGVSGAQTFENQPEYNEVNPGQECRLTCKILHKKGQCSWQKDNKPVGIYLGKYEWAGNPDVGDCSIRILSAALEYDDGEWECQVTASDFAAQDALTSRPVKLVVRVPPNAPQIEFNGTQVPMGKNMTIEGGARTSVKCTSRYGNPPPFLKWFVGDDEIVGVNQTNKTEEDNAKKWSATSVLDYTFMKAQNGKGLRCVAVHEAYPTKSRHTQVTLDVQYGPEVKVTGLPEGDLEENKTPLTLRCLADANPAPQVSWRRIGGAQTYSFQETLEFRPLLRKHSGTYVCDAKNFLGTAQTTPVVVDVKYPPKVTGVRPDGPVSANLYNRTVLQCQADGNPPPSYEWLQKTEKTREPEEATYIRGSDPMLVIHNVTYDYHGKYFCKASNVIAGSPRTALSNPVDLTVYGAPQILRHSVDRDVGVEKGGVALMNIVFCSNPAPSKAVWQWGSNELEAGAPMGRFKAEKIQKTPREDCYEAKFRISDADNSDARHYYLNVENDRGIDKYSTNLQVRDPVSMSTVIGVIGGSLILLVFVVMIILYAFKADKWCFSQRGDFKPTDLESDRSDMDESVRDEHAQIGKSTFGGIAQVEHKYPPHHHHLHSNTALPPPRKSRTPQPMLSPELHVPKEPRSERNFRGRAYPTEPRKDINYADLQLPKTSNNGSMKKTRNQQYLHQQQFQHHLHLQQQQQLQHQHFQANSTLNSARRPHGDIQFIPKANEQAEV